MALSYNLAGTAAADPILSGLPMSLIGLSKSFSLTQGIKGFIDEATGYPGVTEVTAGLTPGASQVTPAGFTGSWVFSTKRLTVTSTTGVQVGHYIYINSGVEYIVGRVVTVVSSTVLALDVGFNSDRSNVGYQIAWAFLGTAGQAQLLTSAAGKQLFWKFEGRTAANNRGEANPIEFWIRSAPADLMQINGGAPTNWRTNSATPEFRVLPSWPNKGGIISLALTGASGITWWDDTVGEKEMFEIVNQAGFSIKLVGGDGPKSATVVARGKVGSTATRELGLVSGELDTLAPEVAALVTAY